MKENRYTPLPGERVTVTFLDGSTAEGNVLRVLDDERVSVGFDDCPDSRYVYPMVQVTRSSESGDKDE